MRVIVVGGGDTGTSPTAQMINLSTLSPSWGSPTSIPDGRPRVMSQDEDRDVVLRVVAPPTFPLEVGPRAANRAEHVPSENPRANVRESSRREGLIDSGCATIRPKEGPLERARREGPLMQICPAHAEGILKILTRAGSVSVKRDGKALNSNSCHFHPSFGIDA